MPVKLKDITVDNGNERVEVRIRIEPYDGQFSAEFNGQKVTSFNVQELEEQLTRLHLSQLATEWIPYVFLTQASHGRVNIAYKLQSETVFHIPKNQTYREKQSGKEVEYLQKHLWQEAELVDGEVVADERRAPTTKPRSHADAIQVIASPMVLDAVVVWESGQASIRERAQVILDEGLANEGRLRTWVGEDGGERTEQDLFDQLVRS